MSGPSVLRVRSHAQAAGFLLWLLAVVCWLAGCTVQPAAPVPGTQDKLADYARVAGAIRSRYDQALPSLPLSKQRHYAQRLYRLTGESRYLPIIRAHGQRLLSRIDAEIQALGVPGHAERRAAESLAAYPVRTQKQRRRKQMRARWGQVIYAENLVFDLVQAKYHGLLNNEALPGHQRALDYLAGVDFRSFVLDPGVLAVYAAQVANLTYYLHGLGIIDLRQEVIAAFRRKYPPQRDRLLTDAEYRNKIYGMTHFVIAASDYYQKPVSAGEFRWVLDEFEASVDQILARTKEDIYTEVGISFLLAGQARHPVVTRLRDELVGAFDPAAQMIPSEQGETDLAAGEHRNVLAIMLLDWPGQLHPGPVLDPRLLHAQ